MVYTVFYHFAVHKLPNFPGQDQLEVCLALIGCLHRSRPGLRWLKEDSQLTGFNRMIALCLPNMAAKLKNEIRLILCSSATE